MPLEQYVLATTLAELAPAALEPDAAERLFEVQAIVARTYAVANLGRHAAEGFDLCTTTHCQVADFARVTSSRWRAVAERAVTRTAGLILVYQGRPAETVFHADCGGHTSAAEDIWGGPPHPYLRAQRDDAPGRPSHGTWHFEVRWSDLRTILDRDPRTALGPGRPGLRVVRQDKVGRVLEIELRASRRIQARGEDFRAAVARTLGPRAIRSTWFRVRDRGDRLVFDGRGFGHGVGLCQVGAEAWIGAGRRPAVVLETYFPGTRLLAARRGDGAASRMVLPPRLPLP